METRYKIIPNTIAVLHWIFYGLYVLPIIINPETWFFGEKYSGLTAIIIHLVIGILGMMTGYLIYKNYRISYFAGIVLFATVTVSTLVNHFSCWESDLYYK